MTRRHLFKLIFGAPLAALLPATKKPQTITLNISTDSAGFCAMLPKIKEDITQAIAEGMRRDSDRKFKELVERDTQNAFNALKASDKRLKIYNIHNKGYRILGEQPQVTHFDEEA